MLVAAPRSLEQVKLSLREMQVVQAGRSASRVRPRATFQRCRSVDTTSTGSPAAPPGNHLSGDLVSGRPQADSVPIFEPGGGRTSPMRFSAARCCYVATGGERARRPCFT